MRIEVHVHEDTDPLTFGEFLQKEAHATGYRLRRNSGQLMNFQATLVVEPKYTKRLGGDPAWSERYIAISAEIYKLPERKTT